MKPTQIPHISPEEALDRLEHESALRIFQATAAAAHRPIAERGSLPAICNFYLAPILALGGEAAVQRTLEKLSYYDQDFESLPDHPWAINFVHGLTDTIRTHT